MEIKEGWGGVDYYKKSDILNEFCQEMTWNDNLTLSEFKILIKNHKYFDEVSAALKINESFLEDRINLWIRFRKEDRDEIKNDPYLMNIVSLRIKLFSLINNKNNISNEDIIKEIDPILLEKLSHNSEFNLKGWIDYIRKIIND